MVQPERKRFSKGLNSFLNDAGVELWHDNGKIKYHSPRAKKQEEKK